MLINFWKNLGENFRRVYLPAHILVLIGIVSLFTGDTSWHWLWIVYPAWFILGHIGFGIFIHKYWCHKSFKTYLWIARLGAYLGLFAGTGSPVMVKAIHLGEHHPHTDTMNDPHTPLRGFWWSYFLWLNHRWDLKKLWIAKDLLKDPYIKFLHHNYYKLYWAGFILLCLVDWRLAVFTIAFTTVIEFHLSGLVNSLGHIPHKGSYQNYTTRDNSQNIKWLSWITLGLGLHNNHHGEPWNYNYARKPGEFDFAAWFVPLITKKDEK